MFRYFLVFEDASSNYEAVQGVGGDDRTVKLWDLQSGQCLQTLEGHTRAVVSISFHPQGHLLVSGHDRTLKLWDVQQGTQIQTPIGHIGAIRSVIPIF